MSDNEVSMRVIALASQPVRNKTEYRDRERQLSALLLNETGGITEGYWSAMDVVRGWLDEADSRPVTPEPADSELTSRSIFAPKQTDEAAE